VVHGAEAVGGGVQARPFSPRRFWIGSLVALLFYALTPLGRAFGDGVDLGLALEAGGGSHHWLLAQLGRGLCALGFSGEEAVRWLSLAPMALAVGCIAGAVGPGVAALVALAPSVWFFATTAEVHGLQCFGATVAVLAVWSKPHVFGWRRSLLCLMAAAAVPLFHPVLVGLAPLFLLLAVPPGPWRRALSWLVLLAGPLLALAAGPLAAQLDWVAYLDTTSNIGDQGKALPARIAEFGALAPRDYLDFAWAEFVLPFGVLGPLAVLGWLGAWRRGSAEALPFLAVLVANLFALALVGIRELGGYPIGLVAPMALGTSAALGSSCARRWVLLVLLVTQFLLAWDLREGYRAEGRDDAFAREVLAELERREVPPMGAWLLTVRNSRWRSVSLAGGPPGVDVRYALDPLPARARPAAARRMAELAAGYVRGGGLLLVDPALFGGGPGLSNTRALVRELEQRFELVPLGPQVSELRPRAPARAQEEDP